VGLVFGSGILLWTVGWVTRYGISIKMLISRLHLSYYFISRSCRSSSMGRSDLCNSL